MIDDIFAVKFKDMKRDKSAEKRSAGYYFSPHDYYNNKRNSHRFKATNCTEIRKKLIKPPTDHVLQPNSGIKVKLGKDIFVNKIGEKKQKYKGGSSGY